MIPMKKSVKCFRCGYCGQPTDKDGLVLSFEQISEQEGADWDGADQAHGECCAQEEQEKHNAMMLEIARDEGYI